MRLFFISLIIALICMLPEYAEIQNWALPGWINSWLLIPSTCLGYMEVFFHELGHTAAFWSYGQIAVPAFNFQDGGGVSVPLLERSLFLQGIVYVLMTGAGVFLWRSGFYRLHLYSAFHDRYHIVVAYMGHGGSVVIGCFCIIRAGLNLTYSKYAPAVERYLNMIFGLFVVLHNVLMSWNLLTNDLSRNVYEQGIGGHLTNDFSVISDHLNQSLQHVAAFSLLFIAACIISTVIILFCCREGFEDLSGVIETEVRESD